MMKRKHIKHIISRASALLLSISLLFSLSIATTGMVFAGSSDPPPKDTPPAGITLTNITLSTGGSPITKGMQVTITLYLKDDRAAVVDATAVATLNTSAFTGTSPVYSTTTVYPNGTYAFVFENLTYTGNAKDFNVSIAYPDASSPVEMLDLPVSINQLVPWVAPDEEKPTPETPVPTNFILRDANYGSETVYAGKPFHLSVVILATSGSSSVSNVSVSFTPPEEMTFVDGSSVVYIGSMSQGTTSTIGVNLMPNGNIPEGSYPISIDVKGFNSKGEAVTATMSVTVPVLQPERFEIFNTMLPTFLTAGMDDGSGFGSITLVNKGQGAVSNVTVDVVGEGLSLGEGRQFIGNINGGAQNTADFLISASSPGRVSALVVVTYENIRGEQKSLEHAFDIEVAEFMPPDMDDPGIMFPIDEPASAGLPPWGWILIVVGAAAAATIFLVRWRKKKKAAAEAALDDLADEDEDE